MSNAWYSFEKKKISTWACNMKVVLLQEPRNIMIMQQIVLDIKWAKMLNFQNYM